MKEFLRLEPRWLKYKEIKARIEGVKSGFCFCCHEKFSAHPFHKKTRHCHHITYENEGREKIEDTVFICRECHEIIHPYYGRNNPELKQAHIYLWAGLKACPIFFGRFKGSGKVEPTNEELRTWLAEEWFMAELSSKLLNQPLQEYLKDAIRAYNLLQGVIGKRRSNLNTLLTSPTPPHPEPEFDDGPELKGMVIPILGVPKEVTPYMIERMRDRIRLATGKDLGYEGTFSAMDKRKHRELVAKNEKGPEDAMDAMLRMIIKEVKKDNENEGFKWFED